VRVLGGGRVGLGGADEIGEASVAANAIQVAVGLEVLDARETRRHRLVERLDGAVGLPAKRVNAGDVVERDCACVGKGRGSLVDREGFVEPTGRVQRVSVELPRTGVVGLLTRFGR
jgi:hypothetical protein